MARSILLIGESGAGKTSSFRNLDPTTTFIVDADKKGLPWRGWKKQYNDKRKNYVVTSNAKTILSVMKRINTGDLNHVKVLIVDTLNGIMIDDEMVRMKEKTFDKWQDLAVAVYGLIGYANTMRDGLTCIFTGHTQTDREDSGYMFTHLKTSGKKLDKIVLESKFTTVLLAKANEGRYVFETRANRSTAKTPFGCFKDAEIDNDMTNVIQALDEYENGED